MVYLAGYGVQLAGENYFIPVDSNINRDTDIPTEGLRISDYTRQLASASAQGQHRRARRRARSSPSSRAASRSRAALRWSSPMPNMLIAFNAAPGTVAPEEPGPYGIYAQSLAEMIRTGGLSLPEVFDRVRLRVNETSKGAQVPWDDAEDRGAVHVLRSRARCAAAAGARPTRSPRSATSRSAISACRMPMPPRSTRDTLQGYEDFLAAYPGDPLAKRVRAIVAARREAITWRRTYRADTPEAYWSYLRRYPRGPHAGGCAPAAGDPDRAAGAAADIRDDRL